MTRVEEQAIALAGVFQAATLVHQIATRGLIPQNSFEACVNSIFITSPENTAAVFGGSRELPYTLGLGLKELADLSVKRKQGQNKEITRYALSILHLEKKLQQNPQMLNTIGQRLDQVKQQATYFNSAASEGSPSGEDHYSHTSITAGLASLYQDTISTFSFRVHVAGDPRHLQNPDNAAKVRALLLAGVRSALLWRQVGGKRWHLICFGSRVARVAKELLKST